jgi:hypothetical protein
MGRRYLNLDSMDKVVVSTYSCPSLPYPIQLRVIQNYQSKGMGEQ